MVHGLLSAWKGLALFLLAVSEAGHAPMAYQQRQPSPSGATDPPPPPPPAIILALQPDSGPTTGGTVISLSGMHLEPQRSGLLPICSFGDSGLSVHGQFRGRASNGVVTCTTPEAYAGYEVAVELSLDGGGTFTNHGHRFRYYHEAFVESASPSSGPAAGGTLIHITGHNFARTPGLQCSFGWRRVPATLIDFQHVRCASPAHAANASLSLRFENADLRLTIDERGVDGLAAISGEAHLDSGVLVIAEQRLLPIDPGPSPPPPPSPPGQFASMAAAAPADYVGPFWGAAAGDGTYSSDGGSGSSGQGGAIIGSSMIRRVRNETVQAGCGVLSVATPRDTHSAPQGFTASFDLLMQGEAARGLSFSYGELEPDSSTSAQGVGAASSGSSAGGGVAGGKGLWDEFGVARGLSVRLLANTPAHYRPFSIEVCLDQKQLAQVTLGRGALLRGAWAPVHVRLDPGTRRIVVRHDGIVRLTAVLPPTFHPAPTWQFALSGCTNPPPAWNATEGADNSGAALGEGAQVVNTSLSAAVLIDQMALSTSTLYDEKNVDLRVSINAQALSPSSVAYAYYAPPRIESVSPTSGPAAGLSLVTVTGIHIHGGSDYRCRFGTDVTVYASIVAIAGSHRYGDLGSMRCRTPPLLAGAPVLVEISLNGQTFTDSSIAADGTSVASNFRFMPYGVPLVSSVSPALGPVHGGTLLEVRGLNFADGSDYRCRFEPQPNVTVPTFEDPHGLPRERIDADGDGIGDRILVSWELCACPA